MSRRWSDENARRHTLVLWGRVVGATVLTALLVVALIALTRTTPVRAGGDCGAKGCFVDHDHDRLVVIALALAVALFCVVSWPRLVQRYRRFWGDGD